ncbi:transcriptional regulator [Betaproteobacteria bacterium GR16-43]|nr:transcriptional regulator [Betaproteobacteria bacterium GR16-43]
MKDGPPIAGIAALIGDRARADILVALMAGQALTATELSEVAGVTKQTMSAHLSKLLDAKLLSMQSQGRHRYFRLADPDVADLIERLTGVAQRSGAVRLKSSPREPALRKARVCYDHLAGDLGVRVLDSFEKRRFVRHVEDRLELTRSGREFCEAFGLDLESAPGRRPLCRPCLDWSVRRNHLAGVLGAAILERCYELGWAKRVAGTRVVQFTAAGERAFCERFSVEGRTR